MRIQLNIDYIRFDQIWNKHGFDIASLHLKAITIVPDAQRIVLSPYSYLYLQALNNEAMLELVLHFIILL